ncbi:polymorphic toxin-type HINT domain-containing protein [Paenibacillus tarimensis]|uniref:polymorphic toxin-type HINT domain-containing protein n=2 Tax=Paenibacillus tarimensis TaxID=416012 RepID=UPI0039EEAC18
MSWWQVDDLAKGIISSLGSIKDLFSWSTLDTLWETIKAVYKGKISLRDIAREAAGSVLQPFNYLIRNTNHVWKGKPSDKEVKQYGKELGNVLQMVAGSGGALKIMSKVIPGLQKLAAKLPKKKVRQEPKKTPRQEPRKTQNKKSNGCNCFTAGTKVLTDEGEKNIEDIEVGDMVLAKDENNPDGELGYKEVTALFRNQRDDIIKLHVGEQVIETTDNHPFWVEGKGWVFADELQVGDILQKADGSNLTIDKMEFVKLDKPVTVYNFAVADYHTYYVTNIGIWVHNTNTKDCPLYEATRVKWDIKKYSDKQITYKLHGNTVTAYRDSKTRFWWAKDFTNHSQNGDVAFKVYKEVKSGKELHWVADANQYGDFIKGKHKSDVGKMIKIK